MIWDGAFVLAKFLEKHEENVYFKNKFVLELRCGYGFGWHCLALFGRRACGKFGQFWKKKAYWKTKQKCLTDLEYALENLRKNNLLANRVESNAYCAELIGPSTKPTTTLQYCDAGRPMSLYWRTLLG